MSESRKKQFMTLVWALSILGTALGFYGLTRSNRAVVDTLGLAPETRFQSVAGKQAVAATLTPRLAGNPQARGAVLRLLLVDSAFAAMLGLAVVSGSLRRRRNPAYRRLNRLLLVAAIVGGLSCVADLVENALLHEVLLRSVHGPAYFGALFAARWLKLINFGLFPAVLGLSIWQGLRADARPRTE